ncbi:MAG: amidohydrolase family protein [Oscillospiraceae bacterium]|nr:amidohydrolase family protein [Oscillospiraceae bacterium]
MTAIINAELIMKNHYIPEAVLFIEDGLIQGFGEMRNTPIPEGCEIIDAEGAYVGPGLIDTHVHAGGRKWFFDDPAYAAQFNLKHGTTTVLPTLYFNQTKENLVKQIATVKTAMQTPECASIYGLYMEAPYMNPNFGADRKYSPWKGPICKEDYQPILDAAGDAVCAWCVAPERENIEEFVRDAKKANPNVIFTVAHSEASPQQIEALMPYGLKVGTHHTNATGNRVKYGGCRGVCVDETVNYNREIFAELICDSLGIHVDPYMLRLVRRIKGDDRIMLISDSCYFDGPVPEKYEGVTDINFDNDGGIAGSKLTLDVACRNMMKHTGASLVDVFNFASYNPAKCYGMTDRGEIAVGKRADLIFVDHKMNVKKVILKGETV